MLVLPVGGAHLDRSTRLESLKSQRFQLFHPLLVCLNKSLQVGLDAEPLSFRSGTNLRFQLWMYPNAHSRTMFPALMLILRPAKHTFLLESCVDPVGRPVTAGRPVNSDPANSAWQVLRFGECRIPTVFRVRVVTSPLGTYGA